MAWELERDIKITYMVIDLIIPALKPKLLTFQFSTRRLASPTDD
ncbi:uncharacterized protein G2W53_011847 [Senna tora]|uniref:Uncharacterized protein n=1 Tax=Senna tora TaxID=362788 RepID=A0A834U3E1_9FABA|nr:uncharacterized protein G2W53_011847 [Senna tora]